MFDFNQLIMIVISAFLLWVVTLLPLDPFINLGINALLLVILIIYIMQFFGVVKGFLPTLKLFK